MKQGGFDVIIGNPPYGADLSDEEKNYFSQKFDVGSTDTAILFVKHALNLLKDGGRLGFIIPKAFCFASNYKKLRDFIWDYVDEIIDCGKAWQQVKLEQVIVILRKGEKLNEYKSAVFKYEKLEISEKISKKDANQFEFFLNSVSNKEIDIAKKVSKLGISLNSISSNKRGVILNKFSNKGKYKVIGCKEIGRYRIKKTRGLINEDLSGSTAEIEKNSILVQGIVAHIENPVDHIKITACIPDKKDYFIADNINQIILNKNYSPFYIWSILNSKLINWYCYRFIYGKSIRTMRFDNPVTSRIPIPKMKDQKPLIEKAKNLLALHKNILSIPENSEKWKLLKREIEKDDNEIDQAVYELYELSPEEIETIEKT